MTWRTFAVFAVVLVGATVLCFGGSLRFAIGAMCAAAVPVVLIAMGVIADAGAFSTLKSDRDTLRREVEILKKEIR